MIEMDDSGEQAKGNIAPMKKKQRLKISMLLSDNY